MKVLAFLFALIIAQPAFAERLQFDHRLYPPLQRVLDSGDGSKVAFDNHDPTHVVDLIVTQGASLTQWDEAFEILSILPPKGVTTAQEWMAQMQQASTARCATHFAVLAQDDMSITFERQSPNCATEPADFGLVRIVAGKRSWFRLSVFQKHAPDATTRAQWLALLASAHLR